MSQIAGQLAKGGELFSLLLDASYLADPVQQRGNDPLPYRRDCKEHLWEMGLVNRNGPNRRNGKALSAVAFHAREWQQTCHLSGAADKQRHGTAVLTAHVNFTFEDENHPLGRSAFFKENVAGLGEVLLAVARQPQAVFERQSAQGADMFERSRDLFDRRGTGGWGDCGGKHRETLRGSYRIADYGCLPIMRERQIFARDFPNDTKAGREPAPAWIRVDDMMGRFGRILEVTSHVENLFSGACAACRFASLIRTAP
jgi:hypothetical protein